jgi:hypothetical protein
MSFRAALVVGFIFAVLIHFLGYTLSNAPFIYLALPGLMAAQLSPSNAVALALEIGVNALFYAALLWALSKLLRGVQGLAR